MTIYNLEKKDLIEYPFPIIIQDNFLEQSFFNNLSKSFPNEIFENCSYSERSRKNLKFNSKYLIKFINNNKDWKKFHTFLTSNKFLLETLKIFEKNINDWKLKINLSNIEFYEHINLNDTTGLLGTSMPRNFLIKVYQKIRKKYFNFNNKMFLRIDLACAQSVKNYYKTIHIDNRSKLLSGLFYFSNTEGDSNLNIYDQINSSETFTKNEKSDNMKKSKLKLYKSIDIIPNRLVLFLNTPNSFHSVESTKLDKKRNFIYFSIGFERDIKPWNN